MVGTIHRRIGPLNRLLCRFSLAGSWRYEAGKRDLRLDLLRGFAVLAMVADHIGGKRSWLYAITGGDAFFISAAEVFVFISGLLMGMIAAGVIAHQGLGVMLMKSLRRTWTLYLLTVTLTLTFIALSAQLDLHWGSVGQHSTWSDLVISVLTLHQTFYLTDILLLYTLLVLGSVLVFVLLAEGNTGLVLIGSWGLWALWQIAPQHAQFPWSIANNQVFHFPTWQALFVTAMVMGYHRQPLGQWLAKRSERMLLAISGASVVMAITLYLAYFAPSFILDKELAGHLFGKPDLRIGRILVFAGFFSCAFLLLTKVWRPIHRLLGWLLLPLGRDALSAYILHLFVVALAVKLRPLMIAEHPLHNTLFQIAGITFIWAAISFRPLLTTALHAGLEKSTAVLAAGRTYFSVANYAGKDL